MSFRLTSFRCRAFAIAGAFAFALACGCSSSNRRPPATTQPIAAAQPTTRPRVLGKPLLDFSKGAGGFPLASDRAPRSADDLRTSLEQAYRDRITLPPESATPVVMAFGDHYPALDALLIDLSDGKVKEDDDADNGATAAEAAERKRHPHNKSANVVEPVFSAKYIQYVATPLRYADGNTNLRIAAQDVEMGLLHGHDDESAGLVITSAREGRVQFSVPLKDLRTMFLTSAKATARRVGYITNDLQLKLTSADSHSLACSVTVRGFWLLLPAAFEIGGECTVDNEFNAHFANVHARGLDVGGSFIAGFLNGPLKKYDGHVAPLAYFPGNKIHLKDLKIGVDDSLRIDIGFGN